MIVLALVGALLAQEGTASRVQLMCEGVSDTPSTETAQTTVQRNGSFSTANTTAHGRARSSGMMRVRIEGERVFVRPPSDLVPPASGSGDNGWRELSDVRMTPEEIEGRFSFNWVNRPVVRIDRMNGEISVRTSSVVAGRWTYDGFCRPATQSATPLF